jgi:hypothetical protein
MIVVSVFLSLYFGSDRKRKLEEKKAIVAFHTCNMLFIFMTSSVAHVVMTIFFIEDKGNILFQLAILLFTTLPFYILGNVVLEHYKFIVKKYVKAENGKVLILNKEYLKRK